MNEASLKDFLSQFSYKSIIVTERFDELRVVLELLDFKNLDVNNVIRLTNFLSQRDSLHLSLIVDDGEPIDYYSGSDSSGFITDFENKLSILDDESVSITVKINKNLTGGVLSIYSYKDFLIYVKSLTTQALLQQFNNHIKKNGYVIFEFQNAEKELKANSVWFVNKHFTDKPIESNYKSRINKAISYCHFNYSNKFTLVAEDFFAKSGEVSEISILMNRLTTILSVAYLFDITSLQGDLLEFRLNGYKAINGIIDLKLLEPEPGDQFFKIYNWVYDSGNFIDKIGLARNIISLHIEQIDALILKGEPFVSIQSSYKVYEKQNIKQYIEIRNKVSDQLLGFHDRANKIIETFASGFQKSAFALITFYISAIILKVLNKDKLIEVFTIDASILSTAFILCSVIYYFVLKWEVNSQKKRFVANYNDVKLRYADLLDTQDINRILNNDNEFNSDIKFIEDKARVYTVMWFAFLSIFFVTTWLLYLVYNSLLLQKTTIFISVLMVLIRMFIPQ